MSKLLSASSSASPTDSVSCRYLRPAGSYRGFAYFELNAIFIREERKTFRLMISIVISTSFLSFMGKMAFSSLGGWYWSRGALCFPDYAEAYD